MCCGLFFKDTQPVPLTSVIVKADIKDICVSVAIKQIYQNTEDTNIEGVYSFPLDEKSSVTSFQAEFDGKVLKGTMKKKDEAKKVYDEAVSAGKFAGLMQQKNAEIFSVNLGNIPAKNYCHSHINLCYRNENNR